MRSLSNELGDLQCRYATTKAENEQLHTDLRLAQTELAAIRSVLQHTQVSPTGGPHTPQSAAKPGTQHCSVSADPSSCNLTLKIDIDGLVMERARQRNLTPLRSEDGLGDVDFEAWCGPVQYQ